MSDPSRSLAYAIGAIGDRPDDTEEEKLQHRLLVYLGLLMSGGGVLWGSIALYFDQLLPALFPYGYVAITVANLTYFRFTKHFGVVRFNQVLASLLLPFLFQMSLGGFAPSGAVMLWAMLAIVGSHAFADARWSLFWLGLYLVLAIASGMLDGAIAERFEVQHPDSVRAAFFVINVTTISSIVFGLTIWLLQQRETARAALQLANGEVRALNEGLEDQVAVRTRELAAAAGRLQAILDTMADGLVAVRHDLHLQAVNPALANLLELDVSLVGQRASEVLPADLAALAEQCIGSDSMLRTELKLAGERTLAAVASPLRGHDEHGDERVAGAVVLVRDVTLEREIDRMKTDFIATVSHELRTPLTSVLGFAKLTSSKLESTLFPLVPTDERKVARAIDQVRGNVQIIISEGERLTTLINDVLDISKMEAGRMEWRMSPLDPVLLVERAIEATSALFPADGPVRLEREVAGRLPRVSGDFDRLLQVLINLISNAAKFTEQGSVTLGLQAADGAISFSVTDTGSGIDPAEQATIFEKFRQVGDTLTSKPQGTGLGLPICSQIVSAHKGNLGVQSHLGQGATFTVVLPAEGPATPVPQIARGDIDLVARIEKHVDRSLPSGGGGDILVVDDDPNLRELLRQQLSDRGYSVRLAADGADAIQAVRDQAPDLVILDVMMPGISGFDVAAVLKADPQTTSVPILILSILQDPERGFRLGVDGYMAKPTEADALMSEIQRLLERTHPTRRVLVVDEQMPAAADVVQVLEAKGYEVVGICAGVDALTEAREHQPDLIIVEAAYEGSAQLVRAVKLEPDMENVYVVQLFDPPA